MTDSPESHTLTPISRRDLPPQVRQPLPFPYQQWLNESRDELTRTLEAELASKGYDDSGLLVAFASNNVDLIDNNLYRDPDDNTWHWLGLSAEELEMTTPENRSIRRSFTKSQARTSKPRSIK